MSEIWERFTVPIFGNFEDRVDFGGFLGFRVRKFHIWASGIFVPAPGDSGQMT